MAGVRRTRPEKSGTPEGKSSIPVTSQRPRRPAGPAAFLITFIAAAGIGFLAVGGIITKASAGPAQIRPIGTTDAETIRIRRLSAMAREQRGMIARLTEIQGSLLAEVKRLETGLQAAIAERDAAGRTLDVQLAADDPALRQTAGVRSQALDSRVAALEHERAAAQGHADRLQVRIADLERSLVTAYAEREVSTGRLRDWLAEQSRAVEGILAKAGVDLESLLERADDSTEGLGGPLRPADDLDPGATDGASEPALRRVMASLPLAEPLAEYRIMSQFGRRRDPINGRRAMHEGIDLSGGRGARIVATQSGTVTHAGREGAYGISVVIDHGMGISTRFAHLKSAAVRRGQKIRQGQYLGIIGSTGRSTGRHLHYEVRLDDRPLNPLPFMEAGRQRLLAAQS